MGDCQATVFAINRAFFSRRRTVGHCLHNAYRLAAQSGKGA